MIFSNWKVVAAHLRCSASLIVAAVKSYVAELGGRGILEVSNPGIAAKQFPDLIDEAVLWI